MKPISLLPYEYKKLKKANRKTEIIMAATGIISLVVIFVYVILKVIASIPESELATLKIENEMLLRDIKTLGYLTELEKEIQERSALAQKAVGTQPDWFSFFSAIGATAPEGLKITEIKTEKSKETIEVIIQGTATHHNIIVFWMEFLKGIDSITEVELEYSQRSSELDHSNSVKYQINVFLATDVPFPLFEEAIQ